MSGRRGAGIPVTFFPHVSLQLQLLKQPHHARGPRHGAPPFIVTEAEIDELVAKAKDAIDRTAKDYGKM